MHYCHVPLRVGGYSTAQKSPGKVDINRQSYLQTQVQFPMARPAPFQCLPIDKISFLLQKIQRKGGRDKEKDRGREEGRRTKRGENAPASIMYQINSKPKFLYCRFLSVSIKTLLRK